jgi:hypothetical protein
VHLLLRQTYTQPFTIFGFKRLESGASKEC